MAREAVIVQSLRTGLTKAHRGSFNITEPVDYLAHTMREAVASVPNLDPAEVEDVIVGTGFPEGCQGMNAARIAAMAAGFPKEAAGTTVNRFCSSGSRTKARTTRMPVICSLSTALTRSTRTCISRNAGTIR